MKRQTILDLGVVIAVTLFLTAPPTTAQELTGSGEWRSLSSDAIKGNWTATLTRDGDRLSGSFELKGSNVFSGGVVEGEISAASVAFGVVVQGAHEANFSGKLDGTSISGEWDCEAIGDHGVWYGMLGAAKAEPDQVE